MCSCLAVQYLWCFWCITLWMLRVLDMSGRWHSAHVTSCYPLCLLIHGVMIHTAAHFWDWCVIHTPRCALCNLLSDILTFWMLLCGQIFNRLLIVWCQCVGCVVPALVCTHTHTSALAVTKWLWDLLCHHGSGVGKQMKPNSGLLYQWWKQPLSPWNTLDAQ